MLKWLRIALQAIGLLAEAAPVLADTAKAVAPAMGASAKTQADLDKAAAAAHAAQDLSKVADKAVEKIGG